MFFNRLGSENNQSKKDNMELSAERLQSSRDAQNTRRRKLAVIGLAVTMTNPAGWVQMALAATIPAQPPQNDSQPAADKPILAVELGAEEAELAPTDPTLATAYGQYKAGQFEESNTTLQQVSADNLSDSDKTALSDLRTRLEKAVANRRQAREDFDKGEAALAAGNASDALNYYKSAASNRFADEGTRNKSLEQLSLTQAQIKNSSADAKTFYKSAVDEYKKGDWIAARENFNKAKAMGFQAGLFQDSPDKYLHKMDAKEAADASKASRDSGVAATPAPEAAPQAVNTPPTPVTPAAPAAPAAVDTSAAATPAPAATPDDRSARAKDAYKAGVKQYKAGDWIAARQSFNTAADLGYTPGLFEDKPSKYLTKIDVKEKADADRAAAEAQAKAAAEAQAKAAAEAPKPAPAPEAAPAVVATTAAPAASAVAEVTPVTPGAANNDAKAKADEEAKAQADAAEQANAAAGSRKSDAKKAYQAARTEYRNGDWVAARRDFMSAQDLGYKTGLFEDSPAKYLARMDKKEQTDAAKAAAAADARAKALAEAQATPAPAAPAPAAVDTTTTTTVTPAAAPADVAVTPAPAAPANPAQSDLERTAQVERIRSQQNSFKANELVTQARAAQAENRYTDALALYTQASELDPGNQQAQAGKTEMLTLTGRTATPSPLLDRQEQLIRARRQSVQYSFDSAISDARDATAANDYRAAQAGIDRARVARNTDQGIFTQQELAAFDKGIADAQVALDKSRASGEAAAAKRTATETSTNEQIRIRQQQEERERTVAGLIKNARQLIEETKYEEALKTIDQILAIDSTNDYAAGVRPLVEDRALIQQQRKFREDFDRNFSRQINQTEEKRIPYEDIIRYPSNWPDISELRDQGTKADRGVTSSDEAVQTILDRKLPEVRFDAVGFSDVIEFLRDVTGANIIVKTKALETAGIDKNTPVTIRLHDLKFSTVLRQILDDVGGGTVKLDYTVDDGVINISTADDLAKATDTRVYDIRDMLADIPDFTNTTTASLQSATRGGTGGGGGNQSGGNLFGGADQNQSSQNGQNGRESQVDQIVGAITGTVATQSWGTTGSISPFSRGQQLIVTQTPENHRAVAGLLEKLREARAIQISIEARFLRIQRNYLEDIGLDADAVFNLNNVNSKKFSPITVNQSSSDFTNLPATGLPGGLSASVVNPSISVGGSFLDDFSVNFLIRATQASENSSIITAPRLTLFNGQYAQLFIGQDIAYVSDLQPVVGANITAFTPVPSLIQTGVQLRVQGTVSADRKYVTLTLTPSLRSLVSLVNFTVQQAPNVTATGQGQVVTNNVSAFLQLPTTNLQTVQTTVSVPDGGTILLGGQTVGGEIERESGVPGLSKIPFLKRLFTNRSTAKDEQIILILVKPTIIIQRESEQKQFPLLSSKIAL